MAYIRVKDRDFAFRVKNEHEARGIAEFLKKKHKALTYELRMSEAPGNPKIMGMEAQASATHSVVQAGGTSHTPPPSAQPHTPAAATGAPQASNRTPIASAPPPHSSSVGGPSAETAQEFKVLVVDDEPDLRAILAESFESRGCKVFQAQNARTGFMIAQANHVDLVVSDVKMAGGDGVELFESIKNNMKEPPMFIFMTAFEDERTIKIVKDNDLTVFRKPFDMMEMVEQIVKGDIQSRPKKAA
jgi:CheY-like chemotaxis protein